MADESLLTDLPACLVAAQDVVRAQDETDICHVTLPLIRLLQVSETEQLTVISNPDSELARLLATAQIAHRPTVVKPTSIRRVVFLDLTTHGSKDIDSASAVDLLAADVIMIIKDNRETAKATLWLDLIDKFVLREVLGSPKLYLAADKDDVFQLPILDQLTNPQNPYFEVFRALSAGLVMGSDQIVAARREQLAADRYASVVEALEERIASQSREILGLRDAVIGSETTCGTLQWRIDRLNGHLNLLEKQLKIAHDQNHAILRSRTFRTGRILTAPLRLMRRILRKIAG